MNSISITNLGFNNQGIALIGFVFLFPALLMTVLLSYALMTIQFQKSIWVDQCRESLIQIQKKNAHLITQM
ncbi:MAG: hypothetical protein ACK5V3_10035, partial [Bdellovibrionales bacterium]